MSDRISEVLQYLDPKDQATVHDMMAKVGLNGEATVDKLQGFFPQGKPGMTVEERQALFRLIVLRPNKFAPKIDFDQRCEILALYRNGVTRETLARMYGIDRRTVTHIYTTRSPRYKNVRAEEIGMGREAFQAKYFTEDLMSKAMAFMENSGGSIQNNKQASSKAGFHKVAGIHCDYSHRVEIKWREAEGELPAGWYYRDLDGNFPDQWFRGSSGESIRTSNGCYQNMLQEIMDPLK